MNSPESSVFQKGKLLFGLYQAQKYIREKNEVIVVEGYFDVLSMHASGFLNTVATCGTALSVEHLRLLKKFASSIIILFDGDSAGIAATTKAMELGLELGLVLKGARLPDGLDPDRFIQNLLKDKISEVSPSQGATFRLSEGAQQDGALENDAPLTEIIKTSKALLDQAITEQLDKASLSPQDQTEALKQIAKWLAKFSDPIGQEVRLNWIQENWGLSSQLVRKCMKQFPEKSHISQETGPYQRAFPQKLEPNPVSVPRNSKIEAEQNQPFTQNAQGVLVSSISSSTAPFLKDVSFKKMKWDQIFLTGIISGPAYLDLFLNASSGMPPGSRLADLFDYPPAQEYIELWTQKFESSNNEFSAEIFPEHFLHDCLDLQMKVSMTEVLFLDTPPLSVKDFKLALDKKIKKIWLQFAQKKKLAIQQAEGQKDSALQLQLMKEYLDVQRKIKDFIELYDKE